jgi:hypothetical protein
MFVVCPSTVWNRTALETQAVPKRIFGRVALFPRRGASSGLWARLAFEAQPLRYIGALLPFIAAMFAWPHLALPIAQAPLAMILVIGIVEMKVLRFEPDRRQTVASEAEVARSLDTLRFRGTAALRRIAAARGLASGDLHLVVEQSELARIAPLTLVSVQRDGRRAEVLDLDEGERALLDELFDANFTERDLQRANQREDAFVRTVTFDARGVSAHARLAAMMRGGKGSLAAT